jgi:hypothetical protein
MRRKSTTGTRRKSTGGIRGKTSVTTRRTTTGGQGQGRGRGGATAGFIRIHVSSQMKRWISDPEHREQFNQWCLHLNPNQIEGGITTRARRTPKSRRSNLGGGGQSSAAAA